MQSLQHNDNHIKFGSQRRVPCLCLSNTYEILRLSYVIIAYNAFSTESAWAGQKNLYDKCNKTGKDIVRTDNTKRTKPFPLISLHGHKGFSLSLSLTGLMIMIMIAYRQVWWLPKLETYRLCSLCRHYIHLASLSWTLLFDMNRVMISHIQYLYCRLLTKTRLCDKICFFK